MQLFLSLTFRDRKTNIQMIYRCQGKTSRPMVRKQCQNIALPGKHRSLQKFPGDHRVASEV
jgi:hypothetical protein